MHLKDPTPRPENLGSCFVLHPTREVNKGWAWAPSTLPPPGG